MRVRSITASGAAVLAVLALVTTAWAYVAATGSGTASGSSNASRVVVISAGSATSPSLLPTGALTGTVTVSLDNQTGSSLQVGSLVLDTARGTGGYSAEAVRCEVTYVAQDNGGAGWTLGAGATEITLEDAARMGTDAPSDCQGSSFAIHLKTA
jgi:hypothetical protein